MHKYRVTPRAQKDLRNIGRYSQQQWGKAQRNTYLRNLEKRFEWLSNNPHLGKHRPDVQEGYYSFPQEKHVVFYIIDEDHINIIGVPHKDMDIVKYFITG